jgi:hypothetical protein
LSHSSTSASLGAGVKAVADNPLKPENPSGILLRGGVPKIISPAAIGNDVAALSTACPPRLQPTTAAPFRPSSRATAATQAE